MIEYSDVKIESDKFEISIKRAGAVIDALLRDHIDDLAREVEDRAKMFAPRGPTGQLKEEGVIRSSTRGVGVGDITGEVTESHAIGGGFSVRGAGGRFVAASKTESPGTAIRGALGDHSYVATVRLNPTVKHAEWVHEGTGLFGPYHSPIVPKKASFLVFYWHGRLWHKKSVRGQKAQPFLTEASEYVRTVYEPAKLAELRAEIRALT